MLKFNNGDSRICFHSRSGEIRHLCDPHSCGMPFLLRKYREVHKSVARTIVRHRVAHYALPAKSLLGPARTRSPDYPIGTGFPFVDSAFLGFFASNTAPSPSLVLMCSRERRVLPSFSRGPLGTKGLAERRMGDSRGDKDDRVEE